MLQGEAQNEWLGTEEGKKNNGGSNVSAPKNWRDDNNRAGGLLNKHD
jgi:hypothetical protein